jgi:hypothetical protein
MTGGERRRSERVTLAAEVNYEGQSGGQPCRISDISRTGVFIDTASPLPVGAPLKFTFRLSKGQHIIAEGKVVHSQPAIGMGVEFTRLSTEGCQILRDIGINEESSDAKERALSSALATRNEAA